MEQTHQRNPGRVDAFHDGERRASVRSSRQPGQDPVQWLPFLDGCALCRCGAEWTAGKPRWGLAVDEAERGLLLDIAAGCGGTDVEFTLAFGGVQSGAGQCPGQDGSAWFSRTRLVPLS
ncbi:hypothetical protein [Streptomyces xanthophaeus]|uniref:hypothetical protein n=1 Tax=Streptomyces xanthophaeus TaxID=67385 RepID=UPI00233F0B1C|nr:hypothetical protein [Streptomyces xanthophaeus]